MFVHLASVSCVARTVMLDIVHEILHQSFSYLPCLYLCIIDLYCFIPLSGALTLSEVHKFSGRQNLLALGDDSY